MGVFALFEDRTASEVLINHYATVPEDEPIKVFVINQHDQNVSASAFKGVASPYLVLGERGKVSVSFEFREVNFKVTGESAGLAFLLKFTQDYYQRKNISLPFSIAATGIISDATAGALVKRIDGINEKLQAALGVLKEGDKIFCPKENEEEIDSKIREELKTRQIELVPVSTAKEVFDGLIIDGPSPLKKTGIKYLLLLIGIMALTIAGYFGHKWGFKEPLNFQTMEFHYFSPKHNHLNLIEESGNSEFFLESGEEYRFRIKPNTKCYLYIYQIDSSGKAICLFPNSKYSTITNPLKKGLSYWIPSKESHYYLDENVGEEKFYLLADYSDKNLKKASGMLKTLPVEERKRAIQNKVDFYKEFRFRHK